MTSIVTVKPARNVWEQVKWKCKAYSSMFSTVILVHLIIGFLTSEGTGSFYIGGNFEGRTYTLDALFIFSVILMLGLGWMLASNTLAQDQRSIVTTNQTEVLSMFIFTIILAIFTVMSALSVHCITIALEILKTDAPFILENPFFSSNTILAFAVCITLACAVGYFVRAVFQFSKIVLVLLAIALFLVIRANGMSFWGVIFGVNVWEIIGYSSLYILLVWTIIFIIRQFREVYRS